MKITPFLRSSFIGAILVASPLGAEITMPEVPAGYDEISYYLKKLEGSSLAGEQIKINKIIHDAVVNADLTSKKVVKKMTPIMQKIQVAIDSGLDQATITGKTFYLASAVDYFEREKLRKIIDVPQSDWMENQTQTSGGKLIAVFPEKIILHEGDQSRIIVEHTHIHEAVISPDGERVAFFRLINPPDKEAEIWSLDLKRNKVRRVASVPSCYTLLFTLDGKQILFQAVKDPGERESGIFKVGFKGGKVRPLGTGALLQTVVEKGDFQGDIIVYKDTLHHLGFSRQECAVVLNLSGKELGKLKNGHCR